MQPEHQPGDGRAAAHHPLHIGRQKGADRHHRRPGAEDAEIGQRDDAVAPQPERQHRLRRARLMDEEREQCRQAEPDQRRDAAAVEAARLHQGQHQRADADDQQDRAEIIDAVLAALDPLGQIDREHRNGNRADRQVDPEHQRPMHVLDDKGAEHRADDRRDPEHARQIALHPGALGRGVDVADDGAGDRLDGAGADPLHGAEHRPAPPWCGQSRTSVVPTRKMPVPTKNIALAAVDVGEPAVDRHRHRQGQQIGCEHPAEQPKPAEVADDRRHRGGDDGALDRRHEGRDQRRHQYHAAARKDDSGPVLLSKGLIQTLPPL